jgi:hypothetical protein
MLAGVVELALETPKGDEQYYREMWEQHGVEPFQKMALQAPLRDRHYQTARDDFRKLRESRLNARTLYLWNSFVVGGLAEDSDGNG